MGLNELITELEINPNSKNIEKARNWLNTDGENPKAKLLFEAIIKIEPKEHNFEWSKKWFEKYPRCAANGIDILIRLIPAKEHELIQWAEKFVKAHSERSEIAGTIAELIRRKQLHLIPWAKEWLSAHEKSNYAPLLIRAFLEILPNDTFVISKALKWLEENPTDWYSNLVLETFLRNHQSQELFDIAISKFSQAPQLEVFLLIEPLLNSFPQSQQIIADWILSNATNDAAGDIVEECVTVKPEEFVNETLLWMTVNKNSERAYRIIRTICMKADTNKHIYNSLLAWVVENQSHVFVPIVLSTLLEFIPSREVCELAKSWVDNNSDNPETPSLLCMLKKQKSN